MVNCRSFLTLRQFSKSTTCLKCQIVTGALRYHPSHRTGAMRVLVKEKQFMSKESFYPIKMSLWCMEDGEVSEENDDTDDQDPDPGIAPEILRQRFEGEVDITNW